MKGESEERVGRRGRERELLLSIILIYYYYYNRKYHVSSNRNRDFTQIWLLFPDLNFKVMKVTTNKPLKKN